MGPPEMDYEPYGPGPGCWLVPLGCMSVSMLCFAALAAVWLIRLWN